MSYRICLLEDDAFVSGLFARKFEDKRWEVEVVDRADEIPPCLEQGVDLVLLDIEADDGKAETLVKEIRSETSAHRAVPIVVITSVHERAKVQEMIGHGVDAYLFKGHFVPHEVVAKVERILESRHL